MARRDARRPSLAIRKALEHEQALEPDAVIDHRGLNKAKKKLKDLMKRERQRNKPPVVLDVAPGNARELAALATFNRALKRNL